MRALVYVDQRQEEKVVVDDNGKLEGKTKNRVSGEQAGGKLELEEVVAWRESGGRR